MYDLYGDPTDISGARDDARMEMEPTADPRHVKYWTGIGARVNFEKGNCYIAKATGKAPTEEHIPFDDVEGGYALRIQRRE